MTAWWKSFGVDVPEWRPDLGSMMEEAERNGGVRLARIKAPPCAECRYFIPAIVFGTGDETEGHGFIACHGQKQKRDFSCHEPRIKETEVGPGYRIVPATPNRSKA